jgi:PalH/RIM21
VGVGRRPLLQKIATVTVAISLTIASSDTFDVAADQYHQGYSSSALIVEKVVNSLEIRIIRVISDTFLWLAQVQTLIRLFPRHKEKVTIKWLGFAMVSFDTIFSILDSFVSEYSRTRPRSFQDAIPALSYLFELSISLIYASCVVYYSLSKRRFAFWHPKMRNVCLVALVSYISILIPVVFFVLDISLPRLAGWGEYIRWVGAAAASVVVWEWVERIEALERDERKDGILGREIFDGDEMLDNTPSEDSDWRGRRGGDAGDEDVEKSAMVKFTTTMAKARAKIPLRRRLKRPAEHDLSVNAAAAAGAKTTGAGPTFITVPQSTTRLSRSDTNSASTVYAIRYHNLTSPSPGAPEGVQDPDVPPEMPQIPKDASESSTDSAPSTGDREVVLPRPDDQRQSQAPSGTKQFFQSMPNPFKRRRAEPPAEVAGAQNASGIRRSPIDRAMNLKDRFGAFATAQKDRFGGRNASIAAASLPVTIIPAPRPNERTWSPEHVRQDLAAAAGANNESVGNGPRDIESASSAPDDIVVIIPAPTEGRAWSPPDQHDPSESKSSSANSRRSKDNDTPRPGYEQRTTPPTGRLSTSSQRTSIVSPPRVQLTPPAQAAVGAPSRRSTFTRPVSISPISERLGVEPSARSPKQEHASRDWAASPSSRGTPEIVDDSQSASTQPAMEAQQEVNINIASTAPTTAVDEAGAGERSLGDNRDSGGTS